MALSSSSASTNRATETSLRRPSLLRVGIVAPVVARDSAASFRFVMVSSLVVRKPHNLDRPPVTVSYSV
jgi:hypothetical protein